MKFLIIGGGGMVGQKLAFSLSRQPLQTNQTVSMFDLQFPKNGAPGEQIKGNVTDENVIAKLAAMRPDIIFHLACIPSGGAEADFDLGWDVNVAAFRRFLEAFRAEVEASENSYHPRIIFTSSIAVFGAPFPDAIGDDFFQSPQTSYGAQKAISEFMLSDYIRKGFFDGLSIRLPTICVRPGKPNSAASSFFSGIIREPLNGVEAALPVPASVRHWHASPRSAAGFLRHAATTDLSPLGTRRALNMPGVSCTVEEQIEALRQVAGQSAVDLIQHKPNDAIIKIVDGWPRNFDPLRALSMGFEADKDFRSIIETYISDDMNA